SLHILNTLSTAVEWGGHISQRGEARAGDGAPRGDAARSVRAKGFHPPCLAASGRLAWLGRRGCQASGTAAAPATAMSRQRYQCCLLGMVIKAAWGEHQLSVTWWVWAA